MGLLRRLIDVLDPQEEIRSKDISWDHLSAMSPQGGFVSGWMAENLSTVLSCVNAISTAIASLPAEVQRKQNGGGWETDEHHSLARLIADGPNQHQSWVDLIEWLLASCLLTGNALIEIIRDALGRVVELRPIPWYGVSVQQLRNGRLVYDVTDSVLMGGSGRTRRLLESEVLHVKDRSDDGLLGRSRLHRSAGVLRPALDLQSFTGAMWRNGVHPSGALEMDGKLGPEAKKDLAANFREMFAGTTNAAKALILDQGLKWKNISVSPEDAELLMSRRFSVEELARIYNVPPPICGDLSHGSFANVEHLLRWFAMGTLTPWATKLEHEFHRSVFTSAERRSHRLLLPLDGLLRGNHQERWQSHKIAVESGILTKNEIRETEGWAPIVEVTPTIA